MRNTVNWAERIDQLTPTQRGRLLELLDNPAGTAPAETPSQLVACVVLRDGASVSVEQLRDALRSELPEFMVPSEFVFLESLPLNPNGKVDRHALLERPAASGPESPFVAPTTETEVRLATIWSEVLRVEKVGRDDNFFRLGGHSLLALQLMARVRDRFKVDLPLRVIFDSPTISSLASAIDGWTPDDAEPIERIPRHESGGFPGEEDFS